ncbi:uncharacterized protein LOC118764482 [Octopus sinensis]|uniref:Uncharacterized protein LOC118764482 n=1 Tax=Octopus sinensis TaxID=2607531 RepID=A0A7E6F0D1_9MOLL|nr:uncharacterized protein LOC118764482 [Octopus sinensis]
MTTLRRKTLSQSTYHTRHRAPIRKSLSSRDIHQVFTTFPTLGRSTHRVRNSSPISYFQIYTQKADDANYEPGELMTIDLEFYIKHPLELQFIEMIIVGQSSATYLQTGIGGAPKKVFMNKKFAVLGNPHERMIAMPGLYSSQYKFWLPPDIPSSLLYEDKNTVVLEITYFIAIYIHTPLNIHPSSHNFQSRDPHTVLLRKKHFQVEESPSSLVNRLSEALIPVNHEEKTKLKFSRGKQVHIVLTLDKRLYEPGERICLGLQIAIDPGWPTKSVSKITGTLNQLVQFEEKSERFSKCISHVRSKDPSPIEEPSQNEKKENKFQIFLPIHKNAALCISQYKCKLFQVSHYLQVEITFSGLSGKLRFRIPIFIGQRILPHLTMSQKITSNFLTPIFSKPLRFPHFSPTEMPQNQIQTTKVSSKWYSYFCCCCCCCC